MMQEISAVRSMRLPATAIGALLVVSAPHTASAKDPFHEPTGIVISAEGRYLWASGAKQPWFQSFTPTNEITSPLTENIGHAWSGRIGGTFTFAPNWSLGLAYTGLLTGNQRTNAAFPLSVSFLGDSGSGINVIGGAPISQVPVFDSATLTLNQQMHVGDFDVGYRLMFGDRFMSRVYAGARLVQFRQDTTVAANGHSNFFGISSIVDSFEDKESTFFGVGPRIGVDGSFKLTNWGTTGISVIGGVSASVMFGRNNNEVSQSVRFNTSGLISTDAGSRSDDDNRTVWNLEGYVGLAYHFLIGGASASIAAGFRAEGWWNIVNTRGAPVRPLLGFENVQFGATKGNQFYYGPFGRFTIKF